MTEFRLHGKKSTEKQMNDPLMSGLHNAYPYSEEKEEKRKEEERSEEKIHLWIWWQYFHPLVIPPQATAHLSFNINHLSVVTPSSHPSLILHSPGESRSQTDTHCDRNTWMDKHTHTRAEHTIMPTRRHNVRGSGHAVRVCEARVCNDREQFESVAHSGIRQQAD